MTSTRFTAGDVDADQLQHPYWTQAGLSDPYHDLLLQFLIAELAADSSMFLNDEDVEALQHESMPTK